MQSFAVGGLRLVLAAGVLRMCQYLTVLPSVAKELGVLRSTQSGGAKPPQVIKFINSNFIIFSTFLTHTLYELCQSSASQKRTIYSSI